MSKDALKSYQQYTSYQLWDKLQHDHMFSEHNLQEMFSKTTSTPQSSIDDYCIDSILSRKYGHLLEVQMECVLLYENKHTLTVGVANPYIEIPDQIKGVKQIQYILIPKHQITQFYNNQSEVGSIDVKTLLLMCLNQQGSDIHCFHRKKQYEIWFRVCGALNYITTIQQDKINSFIQKIKLNAHLDISCRNKPQDGHLILDKGEEMIEARVATLPTVHGEDIVIRIFQKTLKYRTFSDLKMDMSIQAHIYKMLSHNNGLILVTGPTGSGKTTTLYTMLMHLRQKTRGVIVTIEDPVEMVIDGIRQSNINEQAGYSFEQGLKAVLRQDPDVIMIGEIRDAKTAKIAIEAAYTGHLILSTLHTTDIKSTLLRLHSFGIDPFLINHSIRGIISQQLVVKKDSNGANFRQLKQMSLYMEKIQDQENILDPLTCYKNGEIHEP